MDNPFLKRATEYLRDDDAFLAIVSPEPLRHYFGRSEADHEALFDRLARLLGQPGSGKTTIARLLEFSTLSGLLRKRDLAGFRELARTLADFHVINGDYPRVLGCRLPMEAAYREFWELPYPKEARRQLFLSMVQARSVLAWVRQLEQAGVNLNDVRVTVKTGSEASSDAVGGTSATGLRERARKIESALYAIAGAVVPPALERIPTEASMAYRPFEVIEAFILPRESSESVTLQPLVMFDDAHQLHREQYKTFKEWLMRRELRIARWLISRLDALESGEALDATAATPNDRLSARPFTVTRDVTEIVFQSKARLKERKFFRVMARDMARRYLDQMQLFREAGLTDLPALLSAEPTILASSDQKKLFETVRTAQTRLRVPERKAAEIRDLVGHYLHEAGRAHETDIALAMESILLHRFANRVPQSSLFEEMDDDLEPSKPLNADSTVYEGARLHLRHTFDRPYFYGFDTVCDASSENPEQFLWLTAELVEHLANRIQRRRAATLTARQQQELLCGRAAKAISDWDFPDSPSVVRLVKGIVKRCIARSMEPNAPLGAGASAFGFPQEQFEQLLEGDDHLARVLKFAVAYNAISLIPKYPCKKRLWCLLELGGFVLLENCLTLRRGGFVEGTTSELNLMMKTATTLYE